MKRLIHRVREGIVDFIAAHTPNCHEMTRLISESMDRPLSWRTRLAMRWHYRICVWCERYRDQLVLLRRALREDGERDACSHHLPPEAKDRLKRALREGS